MNNRLDAEVAVLGGGLQGCCIALELARCKRQVTLIEQDDDLMNRASLRNEGKIHLGLVYANDPSLDTGKLQLRGALSFAALLRRWTGCVPADLGLSTPFNYLVAKNSLLTVDCLANYYERLTEVYIQYIKQVPELGYLGTRPAMLATPMDTDTIAVNHRKERLLGAFSTAELAIDTRRLSKIVRGAVCRNDRIHVRTGARVEEVARGNGMFEVACGGEPGGTVCAAQVVNATWANRLVFDTQMGLEVWRGWVHRLKYRVIVGLTPEMSRAPSVTMVSGRYGDVVVRSDATAYLSWYPTTMRGWSHALVPPTEWESDICQAADTGTAQVVAAETIHEISDWYPGLRDCRPLTVDAGVIFAHGETDVDDPQSGLHRRTYLGVVSTHGYHSVNPGKLTTAPLVAVNAAQRVTGSLPSDLGPLSAVVF